VNSEKQKLDLFMLTMGDSCPARYIWDKPTNQPIVVPTKAMEDFIKISMSKIDDVIYLHEISPKLREGQSVRVKSGPFDGIEGKIVRVKGSRRVMVELPGMLAIATTFVDPIDLEIL
jgi:transcription antitermination factor NusG